MCRTTEKYSEKHKSTLLSMLCTVIAPQLKKVNITLLKKIKFTNFAKIRIVPGRRYTAKEGMM